MEKVDTASTIHSEPMTDSLETGEIKIIRRRGKRDKIFGDFTKRYHFGWVPTDAIVVDRTYQRDLDTSRVTTYAHRWNQDKAGVFVVSFRNNKYYVLDGQHRHAALQLMENYPTTVYCQIFESLSVEEEATLYRALDNERRNLSPSMDFRAALASKDPTAIGVKNAVEKAGLFMDPKKGPVPGNVRSYKTLYKMYKRMGEDNLVRLLTILKTAWPNHKDATNHQMMMGLEVLLNRYPTLNDERLILTLSLTSPANIVAAARGINATLSSVIWDATGYAMYGLYNKGLRTTKLPVWV